MPWRYALFAAAPELFTERDTMSLNHAGRWHYEFIKNRGLGHQWRVADDDDEYIIDFGTEEKARDFVRMHNEEYEKNIPKGWMF